MTPPGWWCEAYGPPEGDPAGWPRCFLSGDPGGRCCAGPVECAVVVAGERRRVFDRIQAGAVDGDEMARAIAVELGSPDELLRGDADGPGR